jgi:hypothetical protein
MSVSKGCPMILRFVIVIVAVPSLATLAAPWAPTPLVAEPGSVSWGAAVAASDSVSPTALAFDPCGVCQFTDRIEKEGKQYWSGCPVGAPYRFEAFECERYQCENNRYKWVKTNVTYGGCYATDHPADCPGSTCD